jgi:two-component system sensor histidine kinase MprB
MRQPAWPQSGWHYRRSLASRVILLTTIAVGLAVALVALAVFLTVRMQMQASLDDSLLNRTKRAAQAAPTLSELIRSEEPIPAFAMGAADVRIIYVTAERDPFSVDEGPEMALGKPEYDVANGLREESVRTIVAGGERYRVAAAPIGDGWALVLAQSLAPQETVLKRLGAVMLLFGLAGVAGAGAAGWAVARNGLRPVRRLTKAVEEITRTEELAPLPVEGDDEIARLATAFNAMLETVAASRDRQRRLVADAGHELRTPLTSLRTNLDLLTQADETGGLPAEQKAELLADVRAQLEELSTLVGDLVELARDEAPSAHVVESFDLAEVVDRAVSRVRLRAPRAEFDVATLPWWVVGETGAVERAVTNLLDNAAKWGPAEGTITVRLANGVLTVDDQGPGIDPDDLPHVFERFYRSKESRSMPGSGLGLAIVHQIVERHSGTVTAGSAPDGRGTRMTMWLPGNAVNVTGPRPQVHQPLSPRGRGAGRPRDDADGRVEPGSVPSNP